ncbi:RHS repeat domain-containing protein [Bacteroides sp.]
MIKQSIYLVAIFIISMTIGVPQVMAQKQDRVGKLLKFLIDNETEKLQKGREKLDEKTAQTFAAEVELIDIMNRLWTQPDSKSAIDYYPTYARAVKGSLPDICAESEIDFAPLRARTDKAITEVLNASEDKLSLSKQLIEGARNGKYPIAQAQMDFFIQTREDALMKDCEESGSIAKCENYFKEFPEGKYQTQFMNEYNQILYNNVKRSPTHANFKNFFDNATLNRYFNGMTGRKYTPEVRALYDDYLFSMIQQAGALTSKKQCIDDYESSSYLEEGKRKHTAELEYTKDSVDYELMKPEVNSSSKLQLIREFLTTHKYKEFRDKAHALRSQFEDSMVWVTPASVNYYKKGVLMKSEKKQNNKSTTETYTYLENGKPLCTDITSGGMQLHTSFLYDAQDRCVQEIQVNTRTKKEVYKRTRAFDANGAILSDSLKYADGRLVLSSYNRQGKLVEEKEFNKDVMLSSTVHQYDGKGQKVKSQYVLPLPPKPLPTQISSRTDVYEYDKYGYTTKIISTQILVNNEKRICSQYFMYDEFGNQIDSDTYYEYDQTGRWIRKTAKDHPEITEQIIIK